MRVGDDYYIATSTFEWYPGVQIHHSKDLVHWRLLTRPLRRASQLDMRGDPDSCGVWAPCLTYADGLFYLVYTDVKRYGRASVGGIANASLRDFHNYLVTADRIDGDWSEPIYLNSSGFDPSLFHDDDGRKYLLNMLWDHRPGQNRFAGIVLQEFSPREQKLIGQRRLIFRGTSDRLHRRAASVQARRLLSSPGCRGGHVLGPCRDDGAVAKDRRTLRSASRHVCSDGARSARLRAAARRSCLTRGHAGRRDLHGLSVRQAAAQSRTLCPGPGDGDPENGLVAGWLAPHRRRPGQPQLMSCQHRTCRRDPFPATARCTRGFRFAGVAHRLSVAAHALSRAALEPDRAARLPAALWPRNPGSQFEQALVARRQQAHCFTASTRMEFQPEHFQQAAGLILYYNATKFHYLFLTEDDTIGRHLRVMSCVTDVGDSFSAPIPLPAGTGNIELRMDVDYERLIFAYRLPGEAWRALPQVFDASIVSDEAGPPTLPNFTGAFRGDLLPGRRGNAPAG